MASRPDHQSLPGTTALAGFDPIILRSSTISAFVKGLPASMSVAFGALPVTSWPGSDSAALRSKRSTAQRSNVFSSTIASAVPECRHLAGSAVGPSEGHGLL